MRKFRRLFVALLSCVVIIGGLAALSACDGGSNGKDDGRKVYSTDPVLGTWYAELPDIPGRENSYGFVSKGDGGCYNRKSYMTITYADWLKGNIYSVSVKNRYFDNQANGQIACYNSKGGSVYVEYSNVELDENQYYIYCYIGVGSNSTISDKYYNYYICTLTDDTLTAVPYDKEGETIIFSRTSMTLEEFDAIDLTYNPADYDNYPW